jgi:hypothetical protein
VRAAGLAVVVAGCMGMSAPVAGATGYSAKYCGILKGSGNWCGASNWVGVHSWDYNRADQDYDLPFGSVQVCQRIVVYDSQRVMAGSTCGWGSTSRYYGNYTCICYDAHVKHEAGRNSYVFGYGEA